MLIIRNPLFWLTSLSIAVLLIGCSSVEETPQNAIALINGTLIDGTGKVPVPDAVLIIKDGRISAIGTHETIKTPKGAQVIDVAGGTILPGFINAHVHDSFN